MGKLKKALKFLKKENKENYKFFKRKATGCCKDCEVHIAHTFARYDSAADDMWCYSKDNCICLSSGKPCTHNGKMNINSFDSEEIFCENLAGNEEDNEKFFM